MTAREGESRIETLNAEMERRIKNALEMSEFYRKRHPKCCEDSSAALREMEKAVTFDERYALRERIETAQFNVSMMVARDSEATRLIELWSEMLQLFWG